MNKENYRIINDLVVIKKDQFDKYKKAYDKNEQKKEYARNHRVPVKKSHDSVQKERSNQLTQNLQF